MEERVICLLPIPHPDQGIPNASDPTSSRHPLPIARQPPNLGKDAASLYGKYVFRGRPSSQGVLNSFISAVGPSRRSQIKRIGPDHRSRLLCWSQLLKFEILDLLGTLESFQELVFETSIPLVGRLQEILNPKRHTPAYRAS